MTNQWLMHINVQKPRQDEAERKLIWQMQFNIDKLQDRIIYRQIQSIAPALTVFKIEFPKNN